MRKLLLKASLAVASLALVIALSAPASPAFGVMRHQCSGRPCTGTNSANYLDERPGNGTPDAIYGRGGRDRLDASYWRRDRDVLRGNSGRDRLNVRDGDTRDIVSGGPGFDVCIVNSLAEVGASCERVR